MIVEAPKRLAGRLRHIEIAIIGLLCLFCLIQILLPGGLGPLGAKIFAPAAVLTVFSCDVLLHALARPRRREGPAHYIEIAVRILLCVPLGIVLLFVLSFQYNVPTPGLYVAMRLISDRAAGPEPFAPLMPRLFVAGLINVVCLYLILRALTGVVVYLRQRKKPVATC
jgi:hypothetical protein